jgi:hypothetical protein
MAAYEVSTTNINLLSPAMDLMTLSVDSDDIDDDYINQMMLMPPPPPAAVVDSNTPCFEEMESLGEELDDQLTGPDETLICCQLSGCNKLCVQSGLSRTKKMPFIRFCCRSHAAAGSIILPANLERMENLPLCCLPGRF